MKNKNTATTAVTIFSKDAKIDGTCLIYLRVTINRQVKYYSLGLRCRPDEFNKELQQVSGGIDEKKINFILRRERTRADKILIDIIYSGATVTFVEFERQYLGSTTTTLEYVADLHTKQLHHTRRAMYYRVVKDLKKMFGDDITFSDINTAKITEYEDYLRDDLGNSTNTICMKHECLRALFNTAIQTKDYSGRNPYDSYKVKEEKVLPVFLTEEEVKRVMEWQPLTKRLDEIKQMFIFQINTGLRYSDLMELKHGNIINDSYITLIQNKTGEIVTIPLTEQAKQIFSERKGKLRHCTDDYVFKRCSNQKYNDHLKIIAAACGIDKKVTTHTARHTFATHSINLGIPIEVVSKLLGHTCISTTQIYATITAPLLDRYMNRWNEI